MSPLSESKYLEGLHCFFRHVPCHKVTTNTFLHVRIPLIRDGENVRMRFGHMFLPAWRYGEDWLISIPHIWGRPQIDILCKLRQKRILFWWQVLQKKYEVLALWMHVNISQLSFAGFLYLACFRSDLAFPAGSEALLRDGKIITYIRMVEYTHMANRFLLYAYLPKPSAGMSIHDEDFVDKPTFELERLGQRYPVQAALISPVLTDMHHF